MILIQSLIEFVELIFGKFIELEIEKNDQKAGTHLIIPLGGGKGGF